MIDLRSDTVTKPSAAMLKAMTNAQVGDDVYGEDPSVNQLQELAAEKLGTQAALFAPSGTQSNLLALLAHCQRGDEYIVGQQAHTYRYEGGGAAVLGSIQPQPLEFKQDGTLDLDQVKQFIKEDDFHFAKTRLLCLENTIAGQALPMEYLSQANTFAKNNKLNIHLDGARVFNAAIKHQVDIAEISKQFDSVSICLSKGLGAPVGSVLCGTHELINQARRWRKMLGGGMRQAGYLAAAGIYALEHNVERLEQDHHNAQGLAQGLSGIDEISIEYPAAQTNMVFVSTPDNSLSLIEFMSKRGVLLSGRKRLRLATHLDISSNDIQYAIEQFKQFYQKG